MKETNAERVISNFVMSKTYHPKIDKLRIGEDGGIYNDGLRIGQFEEGQVDDIWMKFLRLPLEDYFKSWKKYKLQLAREANKWGITVVFEKDFDIGFGLDTTKNILFNVEDLFQELLSITRYSQDKDLQTAACATFVDSRLSEPQYDGIVAYSYNQLLNEETWLHAEQAVANYYKYLIGNEGFCPEPRRWLTLLQPCEHCLQAMLNAGATDIIYGQPHKSKWNTEGYFEIVDKLTAKKIIQPEMSFPTLYHKVENKKVEKFYNRRKAK